MIIGTDFLFRDDLSKEGKTIPIELMTGPYKGTVYSYDTVSIKEVSNDEAYLKFSFSLLKRPKKMTESKMRKDKRFEQQLGLILNQLILEIVDTEAPKAPLTESLSDEIISVPMVEEDVEVRVKERK